MIVKTDGAVSVIKKRRASEGFVYQYALYEIWIFMLCDAGAWENFPEEKSSK